MKKMIALILTLVVALSMTACVFNANPTENPPEKGELKHITVIVVHKDGTEKTFTYDTTEKYVGAVLEADGLIQGNAGPYGMEITHVDGEKAIYIEDNAYWAVYEGEEYALQGIDTTPVVDGRTYKLVYSPA